MKKKYRGLSQLLTPDYMFGHYWEITPAFLASIGVRALLIDIDNRIKPSQILEESADEVVKAAGALNEASKAVDNAQPKIIKETE